MFWIFVGAILVSAEAHNSFFWVTTSNSMACQRRYFLQYLCLSSCLHCTSILALLLSISKTSFILYLCCLCACESNGGWDNRVWDLIFENIIRAADKIYVSTERSPDSDPDCALSWLMLTDPPQLHQQVKQINGKMKAPLSNILNLSCVFVLSLARSLHPAPLFTATVHLSGQVMAAQ